jgi:periplasmic mercuric ion binding protein
MRIGFATTFFFASSAMAIAGQQTTILHIEAMMCGADPHIVQDSLSKLNGVDHVEISLDAKIAIVSFDNAKVTVADLTTATGAAGYPATIKQ